MAHYSGPPCRDCHPCKVGVDGPRVQCGRLQVVFVGEPSLDLEREVNKRQLRQTVRIPGMVTSAAVEQAFVLHPVMQVGRHVDDPRVAGFQTALFQVRQQ